MGHVTIALMDVGFQETTDKVTWSDAYTWPPRDTEVVSSG